MTAYRNAVLASTGMKCRLLLGTLALSAAGCFADPPSSSSGEGTSSGTVDETSSSTTDPVGSTSVGESTSAVDSTGIADSSSSTGEGCFPIGAKVPPVPADVVVLVDTGVEATALTIALNAFDEARMSNLAIIAPQDTLAAGIPLEVDCLDGCGGGCPPNPNRISLPYDPAEQAYVALASFSEFDCIFREPLENTSGPVSHLWFITDDPMQMPPENLAALVLDGVQPLRVHVSCPDCDQDLFNANALLKEVVVASGGTVSDSTVGASIEAQIERLAALRSSCFWETDSGAELVIFTPTGGEPFFVELAEELGGCEEDTILDGGLGRFFEIGSGLRLCPDSCRLMQSFPENVVEIDECI